MKHIVIVTTSYPISGDGSEAAGGFVEDFAKTLSQDVKVTVVAASLTPYYEKIHENFSVYRFAVPRLPLSLLKPTNPLHWPALIKTLTAGQNALERIVRSEQVDHVFALWVLPSGYWASQIAKKEGISYSTWALGSDIWSLGKIPLIRQLLQKVLQEAQVNFADGYLLKDDVEKISGKNCHFLPSTREIILPYQKQLAEKPPYKLAFLGRWHPNKGIDLLLESLQLLKNDDWEKIAEVRIYGGGPLASLVQEGYQKLKQKNRPITLGGYLSKSQAIDLFLWADYVLIPSRIESIPVVFSDAIKCHCPVVCMPVGDLPRLVAMYQTGVVADKVTADDFVKATQSILRKPPNYYLENLICAKNAFDIKESIRLFKKNLL